MLLILHCRLPPARAEKLERDAAAAAVRGACSQISLLIDEVAVQNAVLATSPKQWRERLRSVNSVEGIVGVLRDLEMEVNVLGDGLPKGEDSDILCMTSPANVQDSQYFQQGAYVHSHGIMMSADWQESTVALLGKPAPVKVSRRCALQ